VHIPDGFLNIATIGATYAASAGGVGYAVRQANRKLGEKHIPLMGVMAAFIFAAQMLNFPIVGGTSGHLVGAALASILLGPWASVLVMTSVLLAQSLIFQDGGLLALGANVLNMAVIGSFGGYSFYRLGVAIFGDNRRGMAIGCFVGGWGSVVLAAIATALELAISGVSPLRFVLPAMAGVYALIGVGEGLITAAAVSLVMAKRADLLQLQKI